MAALINGKIPRASGRKVVMILSGGNNDVNVISRIIERILAPMGRRVDESSPMVDALLPDGVAGATSGSQWGLEIRVPRILKSTQASRAAHRLEDA